MSREREYGLDFGSEQKKREALQSLFESICDRARETFVSKGSHDPLLLVLTRLGLAAIHVEMDPATDREPIARSIRKRICRTAIKMDDEPIYDEPMAVILASEAWMVEYDANEAKDAARLPPRLHPRRKEILQVTLRSKSHTFSRNWPILRKRNKVKLGEPKDLSGEGMESVWDVILTG